MDRIFQAIDFAQNAHQGQYRKGSRIPYIIHPLTVMEYLIRFGCSEEVVMAGVLHDVVEDTPYTMEDIFNLFGERVAELVDFASEPEHDNKSWNERKSHTIEMIKEMKDKEVLYLTCADKLHNVRSMKEDYKVIGEALWKKFKEGKEKQKWYYNSLRDAYLSHYQSEKDEIFKVFAYEVDRLFEFYVNN